jgi:hypothetical protein
MCVELNSGGTVISARKSKPPPLPGGRGDASRALRARDAPARKLPGPKYVPLNKTEEAL